VEADWVVPPPMSVKQNEEFTVIFSLQLSPEFYTWAIQDANDGFKKNFFKYRNGSESAL